ncbi:MAG: amidohydrolase [Saprospiraceae bacterium]
MKFTLNLLFALLFLNVSFGQYVPVPAPAQSEPILITGATVHLGTGEVMENADVAFAEGKITAVVPAGSRQFPNHRVIDASGKHVYPGFIATNTTLGLQEIGAVRASNDNSELGEFNSNIRSLIAYNTDSEITPTVRSMGVLMAEVVPQGGRISGSSSVVQLDAWNWEDAAYKTDFAIHLNWPASSSYNWRQQRMERNERYAEQLREVESFFDQAKAYSQTPSHERLNLKFEAMRGLFDGSKKLFVHANSVQAIQEAVLFAERYNLVPTIVGGRDAWMITDFLNEHKVPVILDSTQRTPAREDEAIDQPFREPALLHEAGVLFCQSHEGFWQYRNLAFQAGQAVAYGLPYEAAVKSLTLDAAKILGIDDSCGSIEVGKDATLFISEGDALDMRNNKLTHAFIQGREINLDNKQEMLYRRFQKKYRQR